MFPDFSHFGTKTGGIPRGHRPVWALIFRFWSQLCAALVAEQRILRNGSAALGAGLLFCLLLRLDGELDGGALGRSGGLRLCGSFRRRGVEAGTQIGQFLLDGKIAKASQAVKEGDIIEVTFGNRPIKVKVLSDIEPRTKDVAREMYEIISE